MIKCLQCNRELGTQGKDELVASISGGIMGDEYIETYFYCNICGVYTVEVCHDRFAGEEDISFQGPLSQTEGEARISLIRQCSRPWDKKCRCHAHKAYFGDWLD